MNLIRGLQMRLGDFIKKLRSERQVGQQQLANFLRVSQSLLSQIENNNHTPAPAFIEKLRTNLSLNKQDAAQLMTLYEKEINRREEYLIENVQTAFGAALKAIMSKYGLIPAQLANDINRSRSVVGLWLFTEQLPSDKTLRYKLLPYLREKGATAPELDELRAAHLKDTLTKAANQAYLSQQEKSEIEECIAKCAKLIGETHDEKDRA